MCHSGFNNATNNVFYLAKRLYKIIQIDIQITQGFIIQMAINLFTSPLTTNSGCLNPHDLLRSSQRFTVHEVLPHCKLPPSFLVSSITHYNYISENKAILHTLLLTICCTFSLLVALLGIS